MTRQHFRPAAEEIAARWQRRYGERRWIMGVPVPRDRHGTLIDACVVLDIALRHVVHALRPALRVAMLRDRR